MWQVDWQLEGQDGYPGEPSAPCQWSRLFPLALLTDEGLSLQKESAQASSEDSFGTEWQSKQWLRYQAGFP